MSVPVWVSHSRDKSIRSCDSVSIRTEHYAFDPLILGEGADEIPRVSIPQPDGIIPTSGACDSGSIGTERDALNRYRMPGKGAYGRSRANIPAPDGSIPTLSCNTVSVRTEHYDCDPIMLDEGLYESPCADIPQINVVSIPIPPETYTCECVSIGTEHYP